MARRHRGDGGSPQRAWSRSGCRGRHRPSGLAPQDAEAASDAALGPPLAVCLLPAWQGGSWLWVWHDVVPGATLLEDEVRQILLATQIEQALRDPYITMVRFRGADDAREWVCAELERMGIEACVIEQAV